MSIHHVLTAISTNVGLISAIVAGLGVVVTAALRVRAYFTRSRLLVPNAFPLPEVPGEETIYGELTAEMRTTFIARPNEVAKLEHAVESTRLTFLYGESGSGKSTLLRLGLARRMRESGRWIPIYLDAWGRDWIEDPQQKLADATDFALRAMKLSTNEPVSRKTVFHRISEVRGRTGLRPILLLDQIDDYQNEHRERFRNAETGLLISLEELCNSNTFWQSIRDLILDKENPIHVLLTTRDDAKAGLHCFQFGEAAVFPLPRLDPSEAEQLVHQLAPETIVDRPENGFRAVISQLLSQLGRNYEAAVLPMQLRIALAGVGTVAGPLTPTRIERLGGLSGLGALYIERSIRGLDGAWPLLNRMAERTERGFAKAIAISENEIEAQLHNQVDPRGLVRELFNRQLIRPRFDGKKTQTWQLYHDYLADAIVALDARKRKWSLVLEEAFDRYRRSEGLLDKWMKLLSPITQAKIYWHRLHDPNFRLGPWMSYLRLSLLRLLINIWILAAIVGYLSLRSWNEQRIADQIVNQILENSPRQNFEAYWTLASSGSGQIARDVFDRLLSNPTDAAILENSEGPALASLGLRNKSWEGLRSLLRHDSCSKQAASFCSSLADLSGGDEELAERILAEMETTDSYPLTDALVVLAGDVSGEQLSRLSERFLVQLRGDSGKFVMTPIVLGQRTGLTDPMAALASKARGDQALSLFEQILAQMQQTPLGEVYDDLGNALAMLVKNAHGDQINRYSERILDQMRQITDPDKRRAVSIALYVLAENAHGDQARLLCERIVAQMQQPTDAYELSNLADVLAVLAKNAHGDQARHVSEQILASMQEATEPYALVSLGRALAAVAKEVPAGQVVLGFNRVSQQMRASTNAHDVADLAGALAALAPTTPSEQARIGSELVVARMQQAVDAYQLSSLAQALAALANEAPGEQANRGCQRLIARIPQATNTQEVSSLIKGLVALAKEVNPEEAGPLFELIVAQMQKEDDPDVIRALGKGLGELAEKAGREQARRGYELIVGQMRQVSEPTLWHQGVPSRALMQAPHFYKLPPLAHTLAALAGDAGGDQASLELGDALAQMKKTNDPSGIYCFAQVLTALAPYARGAQSSLVFDGILAQMQQTSDSDSGSALGDALAAFARQSDPKLAGELSSRILTQMQQNPDGASALSYALVTLAANGARDPGQTMNVERVADAPTPLACDVIASPVPREGIRMLVDMLKWPTCGYSRDGVALRIVELEHGDPKAFDTSYDPSNRSSFKTPWPRFLSWLRTQKDTNGKTFDLDSPPSVHPHLR
jgi:hypothetical protein